MADLSDIEIALVSAVVETLYPEGITGPTICGASVRVYRGWPVPGALDVDLRAGTSNVSVFPVPGGTRNTTRWTPVMTVAAGAITLTTQVSGTSITFGGVAGQGQVAGLLVDGQTFAYRLQLGDTPSLITAVLAEAVRATRTCWVSGNTLTVPGAYRLTGRVVADGKTTYEWTRQLQDFRISVWCPDPMTRDCICKFVGSAFAATAFIMLPDGSSGRIKYRMTTSIDEGQDAGVYRRDLFYDVEYGTSTVEYSPAMLFGESECAGSIIFA